MYSRTRRGGFPIGFRRPFAWTSDLPGVLAWAKQERFEVIDIGRDGVGEGPQVVAAGLRLGSVDLVEWEGLLSADMGRRGAAVERCNAYVEACGKLGPLNHFAVMLPENPGLSRRENFGHMVAGLSALVPALESNQASLVIEGWPGPGALCCAPEGFRALFEQVPSPSMAVNYDPSHLVRMGIDPIRFLAEFAGRVRHVHAKDTELVADRLYEFGSEQPPTFADEMGFGGGTWRYTIPGHGVVSWSEVFGLLERAGYAGCVSIELEDRDFNGSRETEELGLTLSRDFLEGC